MCSSDVILHAVAGSRGARFQTRAAVATIEAAPAETSEATDDESSQAKQTPKALGYTMPGRTTSLR